MKNALGYAILTWCAVMIVPFIIVGSMLAEATGNDDEWWKYMKKTSIAISIFALIPTFAMFLLAL